MQRVFTRAAGWPLLALLAACGGGASQQPSGGDADGSGPPASLAAPSGLSAVAADGAVTLAWNGVNGATSYRVYRATESGVTADNYASLRGGNTRSVVVAGVTVDGLTNGTTYYFAVSAADATRESAVSNEVQATPRPPPPRPSANARLSALMLSAGTLVPAFDPGQRAYTSEVEFATTSVTVTATGEHPGAVLSVNGAALVAGVASAPLSLGEGPNVVDVGVTAEDGVTARTYTVTVMRQSASRFAQQAFVKASNADPGDTFGHSVALSGDTLAVGAPREASAGTDPHDDAVTDAGAVYVFVRSNGAWRQQAYLKASNAGALDEFGNSLALSGDTLAVAAHYEASAATGLDGNQLNNSATRSGAVYVFTRDGTGVWTQQAYIKASNTGAFDEFGMSVALDGDTLAVGAPFEDSSATGIDGDQTSNSAAAAGAAYVFTRDGSGVWTQQAYVKASNTESSDLFGYRVGLSADTLAVSALEEDSTGTGIDGDQANNDAPQSGAVYVFVRDAGGQWSQQAYVKASNTDRDDNFGAALALDGDTLVVGARYEDSDAGTIDGDQSDDAAFNAGAAYVFTRDASGAWAQQAYLKGANSDARDLFGWSVALSGDALLVGAPGEASAATGVNADSGDNSAAGAGAAYLFTRTAGAWSAAAYVKASNTGAEDAFGTAAAIAGDTVAVGAAEEDSGGAGIDPVPDNAAGSAGAVFVYVRN